LQKRSIIIIGSVVFAISLILRFGIIALTPGAGRYIDIDIYRCSGALVKSGVNPWDFSACPEIREKLRENSEVEWVKESQDRWNFYVSGNLPLNLLYFAGIDLVSHSSLWYRIVFAVQDSLCSVLIFIFVLFHWLGMGPSLVLQRRNLRRIVIIEILWECSVV
jgi:hypothetical protein